MFQLLSPQSQAKVTAFCDVDDRKVGSFYTAPGFKIPIVHYSGDSWPERTAARPLILVCVSLTRYEAELRANVDSLGPLEGHDYWFIT